MFLDRVFHFGNIFGRSGKGSLTENAKFFDRGSLCSALESTGSKLQYDRTLSFLDSMFLDHVIHFGKNLGDQV